MSTSLTTVAVPAALIMLITVTAAIRGIWSPCGLSMISAINPISERARGHRYWLTAFWFVVGAVVGGAVLGAVGAFAAVLVSAASVTASVTAGLAAVCCAVTLGSDAAITGFRLPLIPRQVNERWLAGYRRWAYASGFGAQIGVGLATYVMTAAVYLIPVLGALSGSASFALGLGLLFGIVRGLAILLTARVHRPGQLLDLHRALAALGPASIRLAMLVQAAGFVLFAALAGGWPVGLCAAIVLVIAFVLVRRRQAKVGGVPAGAVEAARPRVLRSAR